MANSKYLESGTQATQGFEFWTSTSGTVSSDSGTFRKGPRSINLNTSSPAALSQCRINGVMADAGRRASFWVNFPSVAPSATANFASVTTTGGASSTNSVVDVQLTTAGKLRIIARGGTVGSATGVTILSANTWYRVALSYTVTSSSVNSFRVYLNGGLEASIDNHASQVTAGTDFLLALALSLGTNFIGYFSDIYVDDGADLADPGAVAVTYKAPASNNTNNFTTAIGANPANRWTNVNERPISTTNGWSDNSASAKNENYGLQAASGGDVDISGYTLLARVAWVWAAQLVAVSGTAQITDNGSSSNLTLTTSPALYTVTTDSASYPSNAAGIGMVSAGVAADATALYECGALVAYLEGQPAWAAGANLMLRGGIVGP